MSAFSRLTSVYAVFTPCFRRRIAMRMSAAPNMQLAPLGRRKGGTSGKHQTSNLENRNAIDKVGI